MAVVDKGGGVVEMVPGDEDEEVGNGRNTNHLCMDLLHLMTSSSDFNAIPFNLLTL